ncbi:MAG: GNAT family N-acetyltransferase [Beijerinckiaceae bacterium]
MTFTADKIIAIETRMLRAWPAIEAQDFGPWRMRFANGYSKRANSLTPLTVGADLGDADIAAVIAHYRSRNIRPCIRMFSFCAPALDARLERHGFSIVDPTGVMTRALDQRISTDPRVSILTRVTRGWANANAGAYGGEKSNAEFLFEILSRITQPAIFATLNDNGEDIAWGIAVADSGFVGLQDIVVSPSARGRGAGKGLCQSLLAWGAAQGAHTAYLHRLDSNGAARNLYGALGFADAYGMHQRIL